jgi:EF-P beta-lysylation protein EpmB
MLKLNNVAMMHSGTAESMQWQRELAGATSDVASLLRRLDLRDDAAVDSRPGFALRVPEPYLRRIEKGNAQDPLLLQVLPLLEENREQLGFVTDPLLEADATTVPALIQKYAGRALLIAAPACAVHCRYCFRRSFPYTDHRLGADAEALLRLADDRSISEVILSGGDPLILKDQQFADLLDSLESIEHLRRLRIHTRLPVVIPSRVTAALTGRLAKSRFATTVVLHINHPNEIDAELLDALTALASAGVQLLNQSVLLAGVNDNVEVLVALSEKLFDARVLPYYLHMADKVVGTHHFVVDESHALFLHARMQEQLPGYLLPRLVREVPGESSKQTLVADKAESIPVTLSS